MKRFFSFDPEDGFERHETEDLARARAEKCLARDRDIATTEGWPEEVEGICWGEIREQVAKTWSHDVTDDDDVPAYCDEFAEYGLGAVEEDEETSDELGTPGEYERDDEKYEYVEQKHMIIYPSKSAGWEQIVRRDGSVGKPSFYVWRRLRVKPSSEGARVCSTQDLE